MVSNKPERNKRNYSVTMIERQFNYLIIYLYLLVDFQPNVLEKYEKTFFLVFDDIEAAAFF